MNEIFQMLRTGAAAAQDLDALAPIQTDHPLAPIVNRCGLKFFAGVQFRLTNR
ncbi:MAG: hypothetical protein WAM73_17995 [Desulfobacterales bacterium]